MTSMTLQDLSVEFPIYRGGSRSLKKALLSAGSRGRFARDAEDRIVVRALKNVSMTFAKGDRVGLIGRNGAGKTTLLRAMAGIYEPTGGRIHVDGNVSPLLDVALGLNPEATGYENITLRGMYAGIRPRDMKAHAEEIAEFSELREFLAMPVRNYSSGMALRLAFAVVTCLHPEILLMDEWFLAGDANFLDKARKRMESFVSRSSILVVASHSDEIIKEWCNKAAYLRGGELIEFGPVNDVLKAYHADA